MRALVTWSGALAGLMMMIVGGLIPSALIVPELSSPPQIVNLPSTWQVPSLFLCAIICGPKPGVIASIAYLTIGLFYLPIFHEGGNLNYLLSPGFGYLAGFIPASWFAGRLAKQQGMNNLLGLTYSALAGLALLHLCGILNLIVGYSLSLWDQPLSELIINYSLAALPTQVALCPGVAIISLGMRRLLFNE